MNKSNEMEAEIRALRERFSRLSAAVLRISSSLDLETVLREVVASARALTDARYGVITTIDKAGQAQGLVTSGFTPDEHRQLVACTSAPSFSPRRRADRSSPMRTKRFWYCSRRRRRQQIGTETTRVWH